MRGARATRTPQTSPRMTKRLALTRSRTCWRWRRQRASGVSRRSNACASSITNSRFAPSRGRCACVCLFGCFSVYACMCFCFSIDFHSFIYRGASGLAALRHRCEALYSTVDVHENRFVSVEMVVWALRKGTYLTSKEKRESERERERERETESEREREREREREKANTARRSTNSCCCCCCCYCC